MNTAGLRHKVGWLIAIRAIISTILLGSATVAQITAPGSFPVDPYTVALNVFGFFAAALLSGSLANSLRSAGARLEQASNQIADLQALNQHVIDSLPSGLATTDPARRVLTFNRAAESITGIS